MTKVTACKRNNIFFILSNVFVYVADKEDQHNLHKQSLSASQFPLNTYQGIRKGFRVGKLLLE